MHIKLLKQIVSRKNLLDFFLITCIFLSSIKLTYNIEHIVDLILSDEPYYLYNGVNLIKQGFPTAEWSPFYAIWYWLLSLVETSKDNINLYYLNHKLLIALTTTFLYLALRSIECNRIIASIAAFIYLISGIPVIWPRPTHLVLLLILLLITIQKYLKTAIFFYYILSITLLFASYIRPEYFVSFLISFILILISEGKRIFIKSSLKIKPILVRFISYTFFSVVLVVLLGIPIASGNRSWWAFASHFALRWTWSNETNLDPWVDYNKIAAMFFGDADTIFKAMLANPPVFFNYIWENFKVFFENTFTILAGTLKDGSPSLKDINPTLNSVIRWGELSLFLFACIQILRKYCITVKQINSKTFIRLLIITFFVQLSLIPSTIIIFPRYHYLVINAVLFLILITYLFSKTWTTKKQQQKLRPILIAGFLLLLLTPTLSQGWCISNFCVSQRQDIQKKPLLETIYFIRSLNINQPVNLLAFDIEYRTFLGEQFNRINPADKDTDYIEFMNRKDLDLIIVRKELNQSIRWVEDEEWKAFLKNFQEFGYQSLEIPNTDRSLLIREKFLTER